MLLRAIRAYRSPEIPKNYFRAEINMLRYCGIELVKDEALWYKIYCYMSLLVWTYLGTFVELYEFYPSWGSDVDTLTSIFMNSVTHVNAVFKITLVFTARHKFKRIMKILHEEPFKPDVNRGGNEELKHVRDCIKKSETMFIIFGSCIFSVYFTTMVASLITFLTKPREEWRMSFLPISIVDTTYSPMFEIGYAFQQYFIIIACFLVLGSDILIISIIAHLTCQFKILKCAFKNAKNRVISMKESIEGRHKSYDECFEITMRNSIKHHLQILDLAKEMEELCSLILLAVFVLSTLQLCFMLFQASLVSIGSINFVRSFIYFIDIAMQIFQYCYFADEVSTESVNLIDAVMEMDWVDAPIGVQKSMILVMARTLTPVRLTAGKFIIVSLPTFMSLIRASFSYFMVLKQVNE